MIALINQSLSFILKTDKNPYLLILLIEPINSVLFNFKFGNLSYEL